MDQIWWKQITKANHFITELSSLILDHKNVILLLPEFVPWKDTMYDMVQGILHYESPEYRLAFHDCPREEAGKFLLETYCKKDKRARYRYGQSYAAFLAKSNDITLNSHYVWIQNLSADKLKEWSLFIQEYYKNLPSGQTGAVFILETNDSEMQKKSYKGMHSISFDDSIDPYDKFTFCALASTDINMKSYLRPYLAELVSTICKDDIELCALCINRWSDFLLSPEGVLDDLIETGFHSDYSPISLNLNSSEIETLIWESQVKLLFPIVERYRLNFVKKHYDDIRKSLPLKTSYGETIDNPWDVELGSLIHLAGQKRITMRDNEYVILDRLRNIRNNLAHITAMPFDEVEWILSLKI